VQPMVALNGMPVAPTAGVLAAAPPQVAVVTPVGPPPQFIQPSGVELPAASAAQQQSPYPMSQQLPAGGVSDASTFVR
jgi:hypothetical protein